MTPGSRLIEHAREGNTRAIQALLEQGVSIDAVNGAGDGALIEAVRNGTAATLEWLIEHGIDVNWRGRDGLSAFLMAVDQGMFDKARLLMDAGCDIHVLNRHGNGAAWIAVLYWAREGAQEFLVELLHRGVSVDGKNRAGRSPRDLAEQAGGKIAELLRTHAR